MAKSWCFLYSISEKKDQLEILAGNFAEFLAGIIQDENLSLKIRTSCLVTFNAIFEDLYR
jgi:hypothetical protein